MQLRPFALAAAAALTLAGAAQAGPITLGDFTSPVTTGFGNPNPTATVPTPLSIDNYTFTTAVDPNVRWWAAGNGFNDCVNGCVTDNDGLGLNVDLGGGFALAGLFVGQAAPYSVDVSFFDAGHSLLGTVNASGASDGVTFAGWESAVDKVASIELRLPGGPDGFVISAQSGVLQAAVPEPAAWALMVGGFVLAGGLLRRPRARSPPEGALSPRALLRRRFSQIDGAFLAAGPPAPRRQGQAQPSS
jgi:hypothetical protein